MHIYNTTMLLSYICYLIYTNSFSFTSMFMYQQLHSLIVSMQCSFEWNKLISLFDRNFSKFQRGNRGKTNGSRNYIRSFVFDVVLLHTDLNLDPNRSIYVWLRPFWEPRRSDYAAHSSRNNNLYFYILKKNMFKAYYRNTDIRAPI